MTTWLISDTHFGHKKMEELCNRPPNFDVAILDNLIRSIRPTDTLIHLGDICIGKDDFWHKQLMDNVGGRKWLVKGNHDRKSTTWYMEHGWDMVCDQFSDKLFGKRIIFSHAPFMYDTYKYDINIHGHLHNNIHRGSNDEFNVEGRVSKLVSVEFSDYKPISLKSFLEK
jgi:calcineurin-like phosphoesterase family protein